MVRKMFSLALVLIMLICLVNPVEMMAGAVAYDSSKVVEVAENYANEAATKWNNLCLGFVDHCFSKAYGYCETVASNGCCAFRSGSVYIDNTSRSNIPLGTVVFFGGSSITCKCGNKAGHAGIYVGNGEIIHSWSGKVQKTSIDYVINCGYPYRGYGWYCNVALETSGDIIDRSYSSFCKVQTTKNTFIKSMPCSERTDPGSKTIETAVKGTQYTAIGLYRNTAGNLWYKVQTKNGEGYLYAGESEWVSFIKDDITLTDVSAPTQIQQGKAFSIKGIINSKYQKLKEVGAIVYRETVEGSTTVQEEITGELIPVDTYSYNLYNSQADYAVKFDKLDVGEYEYTIFVKTKSCYAKSATEVEEGQGLNLVLHNSEFRVVNSISQASCTVTFNANGGSCSPTIKTVKSGNAIGEMPYPVWEGYIFEGWYTEKSGGSQVFPTSVIKTDTVLYARWNQDYEDLGTSFSAYLTNTGSGKGVANVNGNVELGNAGAAHSLWEFTRNADGSYTLLSEVDGLAMDVCDNATADATNVWVYVPNNTTAQKWFIRKVGNGYVLLSARTGKALDIHGAGTAMGTNAEIYALNNSGAQVMSISIVGDQGGDDFQGAQTADFISRSDGVWLWPLPQSAYNSFTDWAGCNGNLSCMFHSGSNHGGCVPTHNSSNGYGHNGIDVGVNVGTEVYAAADGILYCTSTDWSSRGITAIIEHPIGRDENGVAWSYYSIYQHLNSVVSAKDQQNVKAGERIAYSGKTDGYGTGAAHLHFSIVLAKSGQGYSMSRNPNSVLSAVENKGWLLTKGYKEGRIMPNPALNSPAGFPTGRSAVVPNLKSHAGSVMYTFNKAEVMLPEINVHEHVYTMEIVEPTCTESGYTTYICMCGDTYQDNFADPVGHNVELMNTTDATCTESGYTGDWICKDCGKVVEQGSIISAKGHDEVIDKAVAATCTEGGLTDGKHCSVCGAVTVKQNIIPAGGHSYGAWYVSKTVTCVADGEETRACSVCDHTESRTIAAKGHTEVIDQAVAPSCTATGLTEGSHCAACGTVFTAQQEIPATGHSWDDGVITKEPTETTEGVRTYTCTACGETNTEKIPTLEHTHAYTAVVTAPTCTEAGFTTHTCTCGDSYVTDPVDALGHTFGLWIIDSESILGGTAGTKHRVCECGETEYASYTNPLTDVANGKYFSKPVFWAYENAITKGKTATQFQLDADCTRKQIVMFLWRAAGEPEPKSMENPFVDVKADQFQKAILWAYYEGITSGKTATEFQPEAPCTREQIVMFLWRYFGKPEPQSMNNPFSDVRVGGTFEKAILWAYYEGITTGKTATTFEPQATSTRGQIVTFLYRAMVE